MFSIILNTYNRDSVSNRVYLIPSRLYMFFKSTYVDNGTALNSNISQIWAPCQKIDPRNMERINIILFITLSKNV